MAGRRRLARAAALAATVATARADCQLCGGNKTLHAPDCGGFEKRTERWHAWRLPGEAGCSGSHRCCAYSEDDCCRVDPPRVLGLCLGLMAGCFVLVLGLCPRVILPPSAAAAAAGRRRSWPCFGRGEPAAKAPQTTDAI